MPGQFRLPLLLDKDLLSKMYLDEKISAKNISKQLRCSVKCVFDHLHRYGIPVKNSRACITKRFDTEIFGKQYGDLTAIGTTRIERKTSEKADYHVVCQCICGNTCIAKFQLLELGRKKRCLKCAEEKRNNNWHGNIHKTKFESIRKEAIYRNFSFNVTIEYIWELFLKQNGKCALSGVEITLDKIEYRNFSKTPHHWTE